MLINLKKKKGLRVLVDKAKKLFVPKNLIDNALKNGSDKTIKEETVMFDGYAPGGVAILAICITDKNTRTTQQIRKIFSDHKSQLAGTY
jgi:transcriptional/translational regulatory protein YebC/TACO1